VHNRTQPDPRERDYDAAAAHLLLKELPVAHHLSHSFPTGHVVPNRRQPGQGRSRLLGMYQDVGAFAKVDVPLTLNAVTEMISFKNLQDS
jgi:hypothetical protein